MKQVTEKGNLGYAVYTVDDNGVKQGSYKGYYDDGRLYEECTYKDGKYEGSYKQYCHNGQLAIECTYKDGEIDGQYRSYYESGELERKGAYKNGKIQGSIESYYKDGQLHDRWVHQGDIFLYELYYDNGQLRRRSTSKDGKLNGPREAYYRNGQLEKRVTYKDDKKDGPVEEYYENGQLAEKYTLKNDGFDGVYEQYYSNGQLAEKRTYKDGHFNGPFELYYANGQPKEIGTQQGRDLEGPYKRWDKNGCLIEDTVYKDGREINKFHWEYYHRDRNFGSLGPDTRIVEIDNSTEDYYGNWRSRGGMSSKFWEELAGCKKLERLTIDWTDVDAKAISKCKHLKTLTIRQDNAYGYSGYAFTGDDLRALGRLPELESLVIEAPGLKDEDIKTTLHEQFPRLKNVKLKYTDVGRKGAEIIDKYVQDFEITGHKYEDFISKKSLAQTRLEEAEKEGLTGNGYQEKFKKAVELGDAQKAFDIMCYNGLMKRKEQFSNSKFEREFNTPTTPGWGQNVLDESNIFHDVQMKDLGNGNVAFSTRYESQYWQSSPGSNNNIDYAFFGDLSVVNADKGVLATVPVRYDNLADYKIEVKDGRVSVKGQSLSINPAVKETRQTEKDQGKKKSINNILKKMAKGESNKASFVKKKPGKKPRNPRDGR